MENFLNQLLADSLISHHLLKQKVIANRQLFPRLDFQQGHHHLSSIPILPKEEKESDRSITFFLGNHC